MDPSPGGRAVRSERRARARASSVLLPPSRASISFRNGSEPSIASDPLQRRSGPSRPARTPIEREDRVQPRETPPPGPCFPSCSCALALVLPFLLRPTIACPENTLQL